MTNETQYGDKVEICNDFNNNRLTGSTTGVMYSHFYFTHRVQNLFMASELRLNPLLHDKYPEG